MSHPAPKANGRRAVIALPAWRPQHGRAPATEKFTKEPMTCTGKTPDFNPVSRPARVLRRASTGPSRSLNRRSGKWGAPVYVRHEIVHNRHVVERLERLGAVFVEELGRLPAVDRPVIFSAHGVPKSVPAEARAREMIFVDATCPLVSKVHVEARAPFRGGARDRADRTRWAPRGYRHDGAIATGRDHAFGNSRGRGSRFEPRDPAKLSFVTQTTLSVDDTAEMVAVLQRRFPGIAAPHKEDICYATTNRQDAVKAMARDADLVLVIGSPKSFELSAGLWKSPSAPARAMRGWWAAAEDVDWGWFADAARVVGVTAGASAPEDLVEELDRGDCGAVRSARGRGALSRMRM